MTLLGDLRELLDTALASYVSDADSRAPLLQLLKPTVDAANGDYQANLAMSLAKKLGRDPLGLARELAEAIPANALAAPPAVAGKGFINFTLNDAALAERLTRLAADPALGVTPAAKPRTFVIDYSGPNVAKPLHVGHLRSTVIGEALVRILRALGHKVIGDNHLGDWGMQFGILLYGYKHHRDEAAYRADPVRELARLYVFVRTLFVKPEADEGPVLNDPVQLACREETAKLHAGDAENVALWHQFMPACLEMLAPLYKRLDVKIDYAHGESFYNPMLADVVSELLEKGLAVDADGVVLIPNALGNIPEPGEKKADPPAKIRNKNGAYTYTTTDLATIKYRVETWKPDAMLYVVDARQALHFKTVFATAKKWVAPNVEMEHVKFGSILGPDRKPIRSRDGGVVELEWLLDEAATAGRQAYEASKADRREHGHVVPDLSPEAEADIAEVVGIGAVKYADLSSNRASDYELDFKRMVSTNGNTATYLQYAYARGRGILRDGPLSEAELRSGDIAVRLGEPAERALALQLLRFPEALAAAAADYLPHVLAAYLYDAATTFNGFYTACHVLKAEPAELKASRLVLVDLASRVLKQGLQLLGIRTVEQM